MASMFLLGLLVVLGLSLGHSGAVDQTGLAPAFRARPAPAFDLTGFDARPIRLADLHGQIVVLNFWASWCTPCRDEAPVLERASQTYRDRGVVFVGLATWDHELNARTFLRELPASYPNAPDASGETAIAYGIRGLPETIFVGRDGEIARKWVGPLSERDVNTILAPMVP